MNTNASTRGQSRSAAVPAASDSWTVSLPAKFRGDEEKLRGVIANLLALPGVRSVVVSCDRSSARVVFRPHHVSAAGVIEIPTSVFLENDSSIAAEKPQSDESVPALISWEDSGNGSRCFIRVPASARPVHRLLLLAAAALALALGLAGIVLPGLPTTPFVLVASYCLLRSSPGLHARLLHSRLFGSVLRDWYLHRGLRPHVRYKAIAVIALVLGASLVLTSLPVLAKLAILMIAAFGVVYILRLPSITD